MMQQMRKQYGSLVSSQIMLLDFRPRCTSLVVERLASHEQGFGKCDRTLVLLERVKLTSRPFDEHDKSLLELRLTVILPAMFASASNLPLSLTRTTQLCIHAAIWIWWSLARRN